MNIVSDFMNGLLLVIKVTASPLLYRYPYRTSAEGLRSDWSSIGKDIDSVFGKIQDSQLDDKNDG